MAVDDLMRRALDAPRLSLSQLGNAMGRAGRTLEAYRAGRLPAPADAKLRLADFLEAHAAELREIARELRRAAK